MAAMVAPRKKSRETSRDPDVVGGSGVDSRGSAAMRDAVGMAEFDGRFHPDPAFTG